jgi:hypothetical protein
LDSLLQALADGRLLDAVISLLLLEIAGLLLWHRRTGAGPPPGALLPNLLAGLCLMLALRAALAGAHPGWLALALAGAGAAHLLDLRARWPRRAGAVTAARDQDRSGTIASPPRRICPTCGGDSQGPGRRN